MTKNMEFACNVVSVNYIEHEAAYLFRYEASSIGHRGSPHGKTEFDSNIPYKLRARSERTDDLGENTE